ncbi:MAG TPA: bifunctional glutamate N-acetyltransferase/amino-acid acetyltransferase ArgJ [Fibrobacteria bacterium]|nr:bifunctional glutamate N-acetyltransferase/amino-acid acetyltransferase ArgJ [Fibrobacteria bacterium]HOX51078.1 bifunctional glutamate N-acetyltransferase/amino-acid acetyltransferase ArgJ [Fibrobacteria bacterium]
MQLDPTGHPTTPRGFAAALHTCGIKVSGSPDLALLVSDTACHWDAVFTTNAVAAAPVLLGRELLASGRPLRAVLVNSGNANAVTGQQGIEDARETAKLLETSLSLPESSALVSSTGVIGVPLPMAKIRSGLPAIASLTSSSGGARFARGIMTTDTRPKHAAISFSHDGGEVRLGGCAKGAGMIHPRMATMLSYLTCDAKLHPDVLRGAFRRAVDASFNRISVDGDTSTNDTCVLLANGASGLAEILPGTPEAARFEEALKILTAHLAREIVRDGEGATTVVRLDVVGARDADQAERVARSVCNSPLVKCAIHGRDPNWGRILCAAGYAGAGVVPHSVDLSIQEVPVLVRGTPVSFDAPALSGSMRGEEVKIRLDLGQGGAETTFWTCDFSAEYVSINADYTT